MPAQCCYKAERAVAESYREKDITDIQYVYK